MNSPAWVIHSEWSQWFILLESDRLTCFAFEFILILTASSASHSIDQLCSGWPNSWTHFAANKWWLISFDRPSQLNFGPIEIESDLYWRRRRGIGSRFSFNLTIYRLPAVPGCSRNRSRCRQMLRHFPTFPPNVNDVNDVNAALSSAFINVTVLFFFFHLMICFVFGFVCFSFLFFLNFPIMIHSLLVYHFSGVKLHRGGGECEWEWETARGRRQKSPAESVVQDGGVSFLCWFFCLHFCFRGNLKAKMGIDPVVQGVRKIRWFSKFSPDCPGGGSSGLGDGTAREREREREGGEANYSGDSRPVFIGGGSPGLGHGTRGRRSN